MQVTKVRSLNPTTSIQKTCHALYLNFAKIVKVKNLEDEQTTAQREFLPPKIKMDFTHGILLLLLLLLLSLLLLLLL